MTFTQLIDTALENSSYELKTLLFDPDTNLGALLVHHRYHTEDYKIVKLENDLYNIIDLRWAEDTASKTALTEQELIIECEYLAA